MGRFATETLAGIRATAIALFQAVAEAVRRVKAPGFVSARAAAAQVHGALNANGGLGEDAPDAGSDESVLDWCAEMLVFRDLPMHGVRPPSRTRMPIPPGELIKLHFRRDAQELFEAGSRKTVYTGLSVREAELRPVIEAITRDHAAKAARRKAR